VPARLSCRRTLGRTCDQPDDTPRRIDNREGERHASRALIQLAESDWRPRLQHWIAGHQRRGMTVNAEPKLYDIQRA
jgi:hypothetical protein